MIPETYKVVVRETPVDERPPSRKGYPEIAYDASVNGGLLMKSVSCHGYSPAHALRMLGRHLAENAEDYAPETR